MDNMLTEAYLLTYFALPDKTVEKLKQIAKNNNVSFVLYLNELYKEFNP